MKLIFLLLTALLPLGSACSNVDLPFTEKDCGYSAYYVTPKKGEEIEIHFSRITAEILNGQRNCGFGYVPMRANGATINGNQLREIAKDKGEYVYVASPDFDPKKDLVTIDPGGTRYTSDPETVEQVGQNIYFQLHR